MPPRLTPLAALEDALVPALQSGRCCVAFSGGRDSSAMLAVAVHAARARGLPDPVPVTMRFPNAEGTDESDWQEDLVAHFGLQDWERIVLHDELDMLGDVATAQLRRHRIPWPANGHSMLPVFEAARGGTVVTGLDGDGLLDGWQWGRLAAVLAGRQRPGRRDPLRVARAYAPRFVRRTLTERRDRPFAALLWLKAEARAAITRTYARHLASEPARWDRRLRWYPGQRHLAGWKHVLELNAADNDVALVHPMLDPRFLAAFARQGGRAGYVNRTEALRALVGDLLPDRVVGRRTKAVFTWAFWGPASRHFATEWDGTGVDAALVDRDVLRAEWLAPKPDFRSACLLQSAWIATLAA